MVSHVMSDKKAQQVLEDLFIRCRKLNISLCFLTQSYFSVPKTAKLNCAHYVIFKVNNKRELQNIALNQKNIEDKTDSQLRANEGQKNNQLALVKKSNQPKIDSANRKKLESIEFDDPELNKLKKKILEEVDKERTLVHSYETVTKINGKAVKSLPTFDFSNYNNIDTFAGKIYAKNVNKGCNKQTKTNEKKLNTPDSLIKDKKVGRKIGKKIKLT